MVTLLSLGYGIPACIQYLQIQVLGFVCFCAFRALFYSTMGTLIAQCFGPISGNTTNGVIWLIASLFNMATYPMSVYVENSDNWVGLNFSLLLFVIC